MTRDQIVESLAIRAALGNNGGAWATHYDDIHKEHWRQFVRDLMREAEKIARVKEAIMRRVGGRWLGQFTATDNGGVFVRKPRHAAKEPEHGQRLHP
jgi:hypothetical protein